MILQKLINSLSKTDDFTKTYKFINKTHDLQIPINLLMKTYYFIKTNKCINKNILFYKNVKFS